MNNPAILFLLIAVHSVNSEKGLRFPKDFKFGVATSAYQIEGAWNVDGKTESIWDFYVHNFPTKIVDETTGDFACDSYHKIDEDVKNIKKLKVDFYRFSIAWTRILPHGFNNTVNHKGIDYYNRLINKLIENKITPVITIFHWDLPQDLNELGGFTNPLITGYFENYARVLFSNFGDRVKMWITLNEPTTVCNFGYADGVLAPYYNSDYIGRYLCGHYQLLAHANAFNIYEKEYKPTQKGRIGISLESSWFEPATSSLEDTEAAERLQQFTLSWFLHPIVYGDYPEVMRKRIDENSILEGFGASRLPKFSEEEKRGLKGSMDFMGLNHYTTFLASNNNEQLNKTPSYWHDHMVDISQDPSWKFGGREYFRLVPWGLRKLLNWIKDNYNNPEVAITENGYAGFQNETLQDVDRQEYMTKYLNETLKARVLDRCNVVAYTAWSLMDNFEWSDGYTMRFGLYYVDFTSPEKTRTPKESALMYNKIITSRKIPI